MFGVAFLLYGHCRKALGNVLLHCSTAHVHVGMRFSFIAGRRFAFPAYVFRLRFPGYIFLLTFIRYTHLDYCVANASCLSPYLAGLIGLANQVLRGLYQHWHNKQPHRRGDEEQECTAR